VRPILELGANPDYLSCGMGEQEKTSVCCKPDEGLAWKEGCCAASYGV
jgi:hypothetical protein